MDKLARDAPERPRQVRKTLRGAAYLLFPERQPLVVRMVDISADSICVVASVNPPLRIPCIIRFSLPAKTGGTTQVEVEARVLYCAYNSREDGFKIGLQFVNLSTSAAPAISQFLKNPLNRSASASV